MHDGFGLGSISMFILNIIGIFVKLIQEYKGHGVEPNYIQVGKGQLYLTQICSEDSISLYNLNTVSIYVRFFLIFKRYFIF